MSTIARGTQSGANLGAYRRFLKMVKEKYRKLYFVWQGMKQRCERATHPKYRLYGGRGIKVCDAWHCFRTFRDWALANGYAEGLTLDRINTNGDYEPKNCRWATIEQQANNKRTNHWVMIDGVIKTFAQWQRCLGICRDTMRKRVRRGQYLTVGYDEVELP